MGLTRFSIVYTKSDKSYCPGETVSGQVVIELSNVKRMHGLSIKFKGRTKTHWSEGSGKNRTTYTGFEKYFENAWFLIPPTSQDNSTIELQAGSHTFDFSFILPLELPSSFIATTNSVKYAAKVVIERSWKFDHKEKNEFFVNSPLDLNKIQIIKELATLTMEREFIGCIKTGVIKARIVFPCSGYIRGQTVPFLVEIFNEANVSVQHIDFKLKRYLTVYNTSKKRKNTTKEVLLTQTINFKVKKGTTSSHTDRFTVPTTAPICNLQNCNLIDIEYKLKFSMVVSGLHPNINGKIPVTLGHIPLEYIPSIEMLRFQRSLH